MRSERVVVGAAILRGHGRAAQVLAAQRNSPARLAGGWEFVGGKVEDGESELDALRRECREELGVGIEVGERLGEDVRTMEGEAVLRVWTARITSGVPRSDEHSALRWLDADELYDVAWLPADLPLVESLRAVLLAEPRPT